MTSMPDGVLPHWVFPVVAAPFIGSFLGVLITRLPIGKPLVSARSVCDRCGTQLAVSELIPLFSFFRLRGRCSHCGGRISGLHPAIELAALGIAIWAAATLPGPWLGPGSVLGWGLLTLAWIDVRHWLLPDALTWPLLGLGLVTVAVMTPDALIEHIAAAGVGGGALAFVAVTYRWTREHEGLGWGDTKLLATGGAWVGLEGVAWTLVLAACGGLLFALGLVICGHRIDRTTAMPFGPFLAGAIWLVFLYGPTILG